MTAQELRIGNYVKCVDGNTICIDKDDMIYILSNTFEVEPIPLSEEVLLKFGFELVKISKTVHLELCVGNMKLLFFDNIIQFGILGVSQYVWSSHVRIQYLHQLQNLYYALTGKELEVSL